MQEILAGRGGYINRSGYKFAHCPRTGKSRREHLVIMENHLGRPLENDEVVHHCNGVRHDNNLNNLLLMKRNLHDTFHSICKTFKVDYTKFSKENVVEFLNGIEKICKSTNTNN